MKYFYDDECNRIEVTEEIFKQAEWKARTSSTKDDDISVVWIELYLPISKCPITQFVAYWYYGSEDEELNQQILHNFVEHNKLPTQYSFIEDEVGFAMPMSELKSYIDWLLLKNNYINRK